MQETKKKELQVRKILLTAKDVAEMLSVGLSTIYAYVYAGILSPIYLPKTNQSTAKVRNKQSMRFTFDSVNKMLDNQIGSLCFDVEGKHVTH